MASRLPVPGPREAVLPCAPRARTNGKANTWQPAWRSARQAAGIAIGRESPCAEHRRFARLPPSARVFGSALSLCASIHPAIGARTTGKPMLRTWQGAKPRASLRSALPGAQAFTLPLGRARGAPCKTALRSANCKAIAPPLARAKRFCRARPVRAPVARPMPGNRPARKG